MARQRLGISAVALGLIVADAGAASVFAQASTRDRIGELIARDRHQVAEADSKPGSETAALPPVQTDKDPREGDPAYEQAKALMQAIDGVLKDTAEERSEAKKLPSKNEFLLKPLWTETREDREAKIRGLLDRALSIVTDVPVVDVQKKVEELRQNIREFEEQNVVLKEKQLLAPKDAMLPGVTSDTVDSLGKQVDENNKRIEANRVAIKVSKAEITAGLGKSGLQLTPEQIDLLLDSVLSGDLVRLAATFNAAKLIDSHLAKLVSTAGDNIDAARKYFAMHAALFAMLVQAQDATLAKIDENYLPKLDAILKDINSARTKTENLSRADNRPDQKRALDANREAQKVAEDAAKAYRRYLQQQRDQIAKSRARATHDLRIADNTFETVEASVQLKNLMRDSATSFEAIQKLEAPSFDQIFKNEELRREFESLTRKLDVPSS